MDHDGDDIDVDDADQTAPTSRASHIELVEEIPTGHATPHALEVTTIPIDGTAGALDGHVELPALAPLAFDAPLAVGPIGGCVATFPDDDDDPASCSCHAALPPPSHDLALRAADRTLDELIIDRITLRSLVLYLASPREPGAPVRVVIRGRRGSGRHTTIAALAARVDRRIACIDARGLPHGAARGPALQRELAHAAHAGAIPMVSGVELGEDDDPASWQPIAQVLRGHPGPLVVRTREAARIPLASGFLDVVLAPLSDADRQRAFAAALDRHAIPASAELLASWHRIGPGSIATAVREAGRRLERGDHDPTTMVDAVLRQQVAARIPAAATRVTRLASWDQIALPEITLDGVRELIGRAHHARTVLSDWGYDRFATTRGLTALFHGPAGTGKSMVAGLIARELGVELFRVDVDHLIAAGDIEHQLGELFDAAEDGGSMLLFDDADRLFAPGGKPRSSAIDALAQRLRAFEGVAILTAHRDDAIDPVFRRRLAIRLPFVLPGEELRAQLWSTHLPPQVPTEGTLDLVGLARQFALSGGSIRNSALRAAFLAAQERSHVTQSHLERAVMLEVRELALTDRRR